MSKKQLLHRSESITSSLSEVRSFKSPAAFVKNAHVKSEAQYLKFWRESVRKPKAFWSKAAKTHLNWQKPFKSVLDWKAPDARWFGGGKLNASVNCIDRHAQSGLRNKAAIIWEGENGDSRTLTYNDLLREVCQCANALSQLGVKPGDRVSIYMPMIPEAIIAMQAFSRVGAMHNVVFAGFSSDALADRNNDAKARVVITADGGYRKGQTVGLKSNVDAALAKSPSVEHVLVVRRTGEKVSMKAGRDHWWHEVVTTQKTDFSPFFSESEHPLFMLYTSGSTGKPKEFSTPQPDTSLAPHFLQNTFSTLSRVTRSGVRQILVGSQGILM